jgi:Fibronectin type III domain
VIASNSAGTSAESLPSLPVSAATEPLALPDAPQSVSVRIEGSRASIHFGTPREHGTKVLAYVIFIDPDNSKQTFTGRRLITLEGSHVTCVTLDGLEPGKHYRFGVAAVNPSGEGEQTWVEEKRQP